MADQIIIVGASHAGISCAEQLRANGYAGRICIIDRLLGAPLERPPFAISFPSKITERLSLFFVGLNLG